ncbi:hypothetical protein ISS37_08810 [candidate division KSB1 bacterium]|nr:hypothetical protein [candidate division KSB1 bacterium]
MKNLLSTLLFTIFFVFKVSFAEDFPIKDRFYRGHDIGARAAAMGGAFVALANDASGIYWNPAGLSNLNRDFLNISYHFLPQQRPSWTALVKPSRLIRSKQFIFIGVASKDGGFAWRPLANVNEKNSYLQETNVQGDVIEKWTDVEYGLNEFTLSLVELRGSVSIGLNIKYLDGSLAFARKWKLNDSWQEPYANIDHGRGFSGDFGFLIMGDHLNIGLSVSDLLSRIYWADYPTQSLETNAALGLALKLRELTLAGDIEGRIKERSDFFYHLGFEKRFIKKNRRTQQGYPRRSSESIWSRIKSGSFFFRGGVTGKPQKSSEPGVFSIGSGYFYQNYGLDIAVLNEDIMKFGDTNSSLFQLSVVSTF